MNNQEIKNFIKNVLDYYKQVNKNLIELKALMQIELKKTNNKNYNYEDFNDFYAKRFYKLNEETRECFNHIYWSKKDLDKLETKKEHAKYDRGEEYEILKPELKDIWTAFLFLSGYANLSNKKSFKVFFQLQEEFKEWKNKNLFFTFEEMLDDGFSSKDKWCNSKYLEINESVLDLGFSEFEIYKNYGFCVQLSKYKPIKNDEYYNKVLKKIRVEKIFKEFLVKENKDVIYLLKELTSELNNFINTTMEKARKSNEENENENYGEYYE